MKNFLQKLACVACSFLLAGLAHAGDKHLFYVHGCCLKKTGTRGYESIVKGLKDSGYKVVFELRNDDSDDAVKSYANSISEQVKALLANGVAAEDVTVSGYSLGSITTIHAAIAIANPRVNYVLLAGCPGPKARAVDFDYGKVQGRVLSIMDIQDDRFGSCKGKLPDNVTQKEVSFDSGKGHMVFRLPDDNYVKLWKEPLLEWSQGK